MNDPDVLKLLNEMSCELREVRLELMRLRNETRERGIGTKFLKMDEACLYLKISRATMTRGFQMGRSDLRQRRVNLGCFQKIN